MLQTDKRPFLTDPSAASRYFERWRMLQERGLQPVVVSAKAHPEQWKAWVSYYRTRALWGLLELMQDRPQGWTVPTLDPGDFEIAVAEVRPDRRLKDG